MGDIAEALMLAALAAAVVYWLGFCWRDQPGLAGAVVKTVSTGLLAVVLWRQAADTPLLWTIALGMTLGAAGDWFLARRGETAFLAGMAAFGAGHLAYAGGMLARSSVLGFDGISLPEWAALAVLLLLILSTEIWLAPRTGALRWPVRAYVLLIGVLGVAAVLLTERNGQAAWRLGTALFLASDLMLALRLFVVADANRQRLLSLALWPAYWLGQVLIGVSALGFWGALGH